MQDEKLSPEISHNEDVKLDRIDSLDAPSLGGSVQNVELEPEVGVVTWLVVLSCSLGWMSIVWTLVTIGLQQASLFALFDGNSKDGVWLQNAATTVSVVLSVPLARASDNVGRKWLIISCQAAGAAGTFIIGASTSTGMAIAGSCLYGIMFSIGPLLYAIPAEILPRRYRGIANCCANFGSTTGGILAATAGQKVSTLFVGKTSGTRWAFYMPAILQVIAMVAMFVTYRPPPTPNPLNRSLSSRMLDFDKGGSALLTAALVPLLVGLTWGGGAYPWKSAHAIAPTVIGCVLFIVLILHQTLYKKDGLFNARMFAHRNFALSLLCIFTEGVFYYTFNAYYGAQTGILYTQSPGGIGLRFACFFFPQLPLYIIVGYVTARIRKFKACIVGGFVLFCGAMIGLSQAGPNDPNLAVGMAVLSGVGWIPGLVLLLATGQLAVPTELLGAATALMLTVRALGGAVGVAISSSIFNSKVAEFLPVGVATAAVEAGLPPAEVVAFVTALVGGDIPALEALPGITPAILGAGTIALRKAFSMALSYIWYFEIAFLGLAAVCACFLEDVGKQMTWLVNRPVEAIHHKHEQKEVSHA